MAGIFERMSLIVKANVNDIIDRFEDPEKIVDQTIIDATEEYTKLKEESLDIIANETLLKKKADDLKNEADKWHGIAANALKAGNEDDARTALEKENDYRKRYDGQMASYKASKKAADSIREKLRIMEDEINDMKQKSSEIKAKAVTAKVTKKASEIISGDVNRGAFEAFARMEEKADKELAKAEASESLSADHVSDEEKELEEKYSGTGSANTDEALRKLKEELGM